MITIKFTVTEEEAAVIVGMANLLSETTPDDDSRSKFEKLESKLSKQAAQQGYKRE